MKNIQKIFFTLLFVVLLNTFFSVAHAYESGGDDENPFTILYDDASLKSDLGQTVTLSVLFQIPDGFYLYREAMKVTPDANNPLTFKELTLPPAEMKEDPFSGETVHVYYHEVSLGVVVTLPNNAWNSPLIFTGNLRFQGCSTNLCYRPMTVPVKITVEPFEIAKSPSVSTINAVDNQSDDNALESTYQKIVRLIRTGDFVKIVDQGFGFALFLAFIGGVLTNFTPCVWPMIPITLAHIGVKKQGSALKNIPAILVLILGMATMYSVLGVTAALLGKGLGFFFQNIFFVIFLDLTIFAMALSFLGLYQIKLPGTLLNKIASISYSGYKGDFFVGLTMGIMAAPCVGPVVGPLLAFVAQTKNISAGFWLLLFYAFGLGSLFLVLGLLHGSVPKKLRSGAWTLWFERLLGGLLLLVALYFARVVYVDLTGIQFSNSDLWYSRYSTALIEAEKSHKPMVIDFFADWCGPCKEFDRTVWHKSEIEEILKQDWVAVKIDCTTETEACIEATKQFKVVGWPTVVFLDSSQQEISSERLTGRVLTLEEMQNKLQRLVRYIKNQ